MSLARGMGAARMRIGHLEFRTMRRAVNGNSGVTLEIHVEWAAGRWRQALRYDFFERAPHYHQLHIDGRDERIALGGNDASTILAELRELSAHFDQRLRELGYSDVARQIPALEWRSALQHVERRLLALIEPSTEAAS